MRGKRVTRRQILGGAAAVGGGSRLWGRSLPRAAATVPAVPPRRPPRRAPPTRAATSWSASSAVRPKTRPTHTRAPTSPTSPSSTSCTRVSPAGPSTWSWRTCWPKSVAPNADATVWKVKLRDGVVWHDGKPVTADDVVFSMERIVDPKDPKIGAASLQAIGAVSVQKIDAGRSSSHLTTANVGVGREPRRTQRQDRAGGLRPHDAYRQWSVQDGRHEARRAVQVGRVRRPLGRPSRTSTPSP